MKASDIVTICSGIIALGSALSAPQLDAISPGHGPYIASVLSIASIVAGVVIRTLTNKTGAPATAVEANAPIVPAGTPVVQPHTPVVGTNVSTTSTEPIIAPQLPAEPAAPAPPT